eukprot:gnl/Dysnectes_brevis/3137_a3905_617.p1 GENE.gnl/Dysnectes_brevis/3137_a3905_617~~gnl/Dysnectes_brevis/3137_a3905_617.p1  ORF type:complete len:541 (-),score=172.92 gnl/Dysnectes_brevis/3137_a3905_617:73-1695(-)
MSISKPSSPSRSLLGGSSLYAGDMSRSLTGRSSTNPSPTPRTLRERRPIFIPEISHPEFIVLGLLGFGDVGRVYLVRKANPSLIIPHTDAEYFALKVCTTYDIKKRNKSSRIASERDILFASRHPFIMTVHSTWQDERNLYLLLEYCPAEWSTVLKRQPGGVITEDLLRPYAAEIVSALEYLHWHGVIYRDLKSENVLLHSDMHLRLTDFDLSKRIDQDTLTAERRTGRLLERYTRPRSRATLTRRGLSRYKEVDVFSFSLPTISALSVVGTPEFMAPEVIRGGGHGSSVDWWCLGVLMFESVYGTTPFVGPTINHTFGRIIDGEFKFPEKPKVSKEFRGLITSLLTVDPALRLGTRHGAGEIKQHPYFRKKVSFAFKHDPAKLDWQADPFGGTSPVPTPRLLQGDRFMDVMARDLVGTGFILPPEVQMLAPDIREMYRRADMPVEPRRIELPPAAGATVMLRPVRSELDLTVCTVDPPPPLTRPSTAHKRTQSLGGGSELGGEPTSSVCGFVSHSHVKMAAGEVILSDSSDRSWSEEDI